MKLLRLGPATLLAWLAAAGAAAAEPPSRCENVALSVDSRLEARWQEPAQALRAHLAALEQIDRCTRVELLALGSEVAVHVITRDGRSAVRSVPAPAALNDTVDALLWLPVDLAGDAAAPAAPQSSAGDAAAGDAQTAQPSPVPPAAPSPPAASPPPHDAGAPARAAAKAAPAAPPAPWAGGIGMSAGLGGLGCIGSSSGGGAEVWALVRWSELWAGVRGAGASYTSPDASLPQGYHMESAALSLAGGRRFSFGAWALDAGLGATVTIDNQRALRSTGDTGSDDDDTGSEGDDPLETEGNDGGSGETDQSAAAAQAIGGVAVSGAVDATLRLMMPRLWRLRPYGAVGASFWPSRLAQAEQMAAELPALPSWQVTASLGIAWEWR